MRVIAVFVFAIACTICYGQKENPIPPGSTTEQQLENVTERQESETEDDSYLQVLDQFRRNPIDLNTTDAGELKELRLVSDLQIEKLLSYRQLLGKFVSVYELQAVPTWDVETINKVLPFVKVGSAITIQQDLKRRLTGGQHSLLVRIQEYVEKSEGYLKPDSIANRYLGTPQRLLFRYKYSYRNLLQYGITGDKDAGEEFFKGSQRNGFDFYSFHLFARKLGIIKFLALGDYTLNLGQGLTHWQSLAFGKGSDITAVKRQADILRPYNSATEYNFMRGAAITLGKRNWEATGFVSRRKLDGTINLDTLLTAEDAQSVTSLLSTGYHRTPTELSRKNSLTETTYGGNVSYNKINLHLGVNGVRYQYSVPIMKDIQLYNQYAVRGTDWSNYSFDYGYTYRNVHLFGEAAVDKRGSRAFVGGLLASLDRKVDASLVYRNIDKRYQTIYGNAFTENTLPTNERGLFLGLSLKPQPFLRIDAYADMFSFPWFKYRLDGPSTGTEYLLQLTYKPNKQVEVYTKFRSEHKELNLSGTDLATKVPVMHALQNWRTNVTYNVSRTLLLRSRMEVTWYDATEETRAQQGFLTYFEAKYKPIGKPVSMNGRIQYFETEGFESRLYAYESDVLYSFSIPQFIGKGMRYYVNFNYDLTKKVSTWVRWAQTIYNEKETQGTGLDLIRSSRKGEVKLQVIVSF